MRDQVDGKDCRRFQVHNQQGSWLTMQALLQDKSMALALRHLGRHELLNARLVSIEFKRVCESPDTVRQNTALVPNPQAWGEMRKEGVVAYFKLFGKAFAFVKIELLRVLADGGTSIDARALQHVLQFCTHMTRLEIGYKHTTPFTTNHFKAIEQSSVSNLTSLTISAERLDDKVKAENLLDTIKSHPKLTELDIHELGQLERSLLFEFYDTELLPSVALVLAAGPNLKTLCVGELPEDKSLVLAPHSELQHLHFYGLQRGSVITTDGLSQIEQHLSETLETIHFHSDADLKHEVYEDEVSDDIVTPERLRQFVQKMTKLRMLHIEDFGRPTRWNGRTGDQMYHVTEWYGDDDPYCNAGGHPGWKVAQKIIQQRIGADFVVLQDGEVVPKGDTKILRGEVHNLEDVLRLYPESATSPSAQQAIRDSVDMEDMKLPLFG